MELTQEYFDLVIKNLATKNDLAEINTRLDKTATKADVEQIVSGAVEDLARIIAETVANPLQEHLTQSEKKSKQMAAVFTQLL